IKKEENNINKQNK
ncbi:hypothetical protein ACTFIU_002011, partial [Dictyostelium citrinum]